MCGSAAIHAMGNVSVWGSCNTCSGQCECVGQLLYMQCECVGQLLYMQCECVGQLLYMQCECVGQLLYMQCECVGQLQYSGVGRGLGMVCVL